MAEADLNSLMALTAKGDKHAFRLLAQMLNRTLYAEGMAVLKNRAAAEDAAQEALIKIWRAAPRWNAQDGNVTAYARRIVHNCAIDQLRVVKRHAEAPLDDTADDIAAPVADPGGALDARMALSQLNPRQRKVMGMYYAEGMDQKSIANDIGSTEKAVERLLAYARSKLRHFTNNPTGGNKE